MNPCGVISKVRPGSVVSTKPSGSAAWQQNIVLHAYEKYILLPLVPCYLENLVLPGSTIKVKYNTEYYEYILEGMVKEIRLEASSSLLVEVLRAEELVNTRSFPRYDAYLACQMMSVWTHTSHFGITTNISLGGMAFVSKGQFDYGEECNVVLHLHTGNCVTATGKIIRKLARSHILDYSMQFIDMSEEQNNMLAGFIYMLDEKLCMLQKSIPPLQYEGER